MTKFLNNADIKGYIAQTAVTSYLIKADSTGRLVAAIAGTDYQAPTTALLPTGGTAGQILSKIDGTNYNTQWIDNFAQQLKHDVKLGATIAKGKAVYVSSANGTNMIVSAASNASEATSSKTLGLLETGGVTNDIVKVVTEGLLAGLDTSAATAGDPVWLGTSGNLIFGLANKPVAPAHMVFIGIVTRAQSVNGEIFVKVQNGFELDELHNVGLSSVANNEGLFYDSATSLWKNKTIAAVLGYTPANGANYLALTGGTLTGDLTLSGTNPRLYFTDTDNNPDYFISNTDGTFTVYDVTNSAGKFKIYSTGSFELNGVVGIGTTTTSAEGNLFLGAKSATEGGQLVLQKGTSQTYAAHIDNYVDQFRIIAGTDTTSSALKFTLNLNTGQAQFPNYNSATAFSGTVVGYLAFDSGGNLLTVASVAATDNTKLPLAGGTLTGGLIGTTAAFTNSSGDTVTLSKSSGPSVKFSKTAATAQDWALAGEGSAFKLYDYTAGTTPFQVAVTTGAATFSSSVTADSLIASASDARIRNTDTSGRLVVSNSATSTYGIFYGSTHPSSPNVIFFANNSAATLTLNANNTANFASSVTVGGNISAVYAGPSRLIAESTTNGNNAGAYFTAKTSGGVSYSAGIYLIPASTPYLTLSADNSSTNLNILQNGNVGIGTVSPSDLLSVVGSGLYPRITIQSTNAGSSAAGVNFADNTAIQWAIAYDKAGGGMQFYREGVGNRMYITNSGLLGIGTASPTRSFQISRTSTAFINAEGAVVAIGSSDAELRLFGSNVETMTLKSGSVGIGTTSPAKTLHVYTSGNEGIYLQGTGGGVWMNIQSAAGNLWSIGAQNDGMGVYNRTSSLYAFFIKDNRQLQLQGYTASSSYTGTAAGYLAFDSSGNVITVASVAASVTSGFSITSQGAANNTPSTPSVNIGVYAGVYAFIDLATQNTNGSWIDFSKGDGGDFAGRIRYYNTDDHFGFHTNGGGEKVTISSTGVLAVNGNNVWHAGNLTNLNQLTNGPGYITSSATISGAAARISSRDNRTIAPNSDTAAELRFGFTSWNNNNTSPWADYIHLRSYSDSSGGSDNLIMFRKDAIGMRIWQQTWGSASAYSSYVDVIHSSNYSSYALPLSGGTLTGNVVASGDTYTTYGPNSTWSSYLRIGGNGRTVSGNAYASIATTNGNLHIDAGDARGTYINFYAGTFGIVFGNGAAGVAASVDTSGNIWKGSTAGAGTQYVYNSGTWSIAISGNAATASAVAWSGITGKPSTLSGYGIGDAVTAYYGTDINPNTQVGNYTTMTTQSGISGWTHVLSMAWQPSTVANWVSQIAFATQAGDGAYYRTTSGNISGLAWKRLIDSSNIGSQSVNYANSAGSASSAGYSSSTGAVVHNSGRTDSAWYNVGWFASSPSPAYSADGVQIQSSTNSLKAQNLTANGNLYGGASFTAIGSNATYQVARSFGISGADYKHKYILLARVPTFGNISVNCAFRGKITSDRVNDLGMNVDQDISMSIGYGNNVYWNTEARSGNQYSLVVYNYGGTNYLALYMYTAPNYFQGTFTGMISDFGSWLDGNFLTVVELSSSNHSAASYNQWTSTIMNNAVLHAGNASYAYNMNQNVRTSDGPTFADVYTNGWFRNNNNLQGLYSPTNNVHFYAESNFWNITSNNQGEGGIKLRVDHQSTIKGYLFYNSSGFGLLNNSGDWGVRINYGGSNTGGTLYGSWVVNTATDGATLTLGALDNSRTYNDTNRHSLVINAPYYPHLYLNATNSSGNTSHGAVMSMTGVKTGGGYRRWSMGIANLDPGYFSIGWADNNSNPHYGVGHSWSEGGRFIIDTAGNIWCTGDITAYGAQSDARLKTIKGKVPNALEGILKLNGYRFDWKERDVKITTFVEDIGVVAQEVAEVFPELAREGEDGWMSVRYQGLTAVLIEAVKEQQKQIEELKYIINDITK